MTDQRTKYARIMRMMIKEGNDKMHKNELVLLIQKYIGSSEASVSSTLKIMAEMGIIKETSEPFQFEINLDA